MRKLSGRERNLMIVLGAAAVALVYFSLPGSRFGDVDGAASAGSGKGRAPGDVPAIDLRPLETQVASYDRQGRNLFDFATRPKSPLELWREEQERLKRAKVVQERQEQAEKVRKERAVNPPPKPKPTGPVPPRVDFLYVGFIGPKEDKIAAFTKGDDVQVARTGEPIPDFGDKFVVQRIEHEQVVLGYVDQTFAGKTTELKRKEPTPGKRRR